MAFSLSQVLRDQRDLLLFRPFRPALGEHWRAYPASGLLTAWLAGTGRYRDEKAVFEIMGGNMQQTRNDAAYAILLLITFFSVLASPVVPMLYGIMVCRARKRPA